MKRTSIGRLHIILSPDDGGRPRRSIPDFLHAVIANGADTVQYRRKEGTIDQWIEEGRLLRRECRRQMVSFIVNDRIDLALALDADGLHIGDGDIPLVEARRIVGGRMMIGRTTRSLADIERAGEEGADYVGYGPIFSTRTKEIAAAPRGVESLREIASRTSIPIIAIGGIDLGNVREVMESGAYGIAVVGVVAGAEDPAEVTRRLRQEISKSSSASET